MPDEVQQCQASGPLKQKRTIFVLVWSQHESSVNFLVFTVLGSSSVGFLFLLNTVLLSFDSHDLGHEVWMFLQNQTQEHISIDEKRSRILHNPLLSPLAGHNYKRMLCLTDPGTKRIEFGGLRKHEKIQHTRY